MLEIIAGSRFAIIPGFYAPALKIAVVMPKHSRPGQSYPARTFRMVALFSFADLSNGRRNACVSSGKAALLASVD